MSTSGFYGRHLGFRHQFTTQSVLTYMSGLAKPQSIPQAVLSSTTLVYNLRFPQFLNACAPNSVFSVSSAAILNNVVFKVNQHILNNFTSKVSNRIKIDQVVIKIYEFQFGGSFLPLPSLQRTFVKIQLQHKG